VVTLRHKSCDHEWQVAQELADRVQHDLNGGQGGKSPPIVCPGCEAADRYSAFEVVADA
jgi:hypothetical protein